jgi:Polysaccharide lyase
MRAMVVGWRVRLVLVAAAAAAPACSPRLNLGSEFLWLAQHETGDLSEWTEGGKGGTSADMPDTSLAVSTDFAHSGKYSVKLSNAAVTNYETARLWRSDNYPEEAYYSAWYYLPRAYQTTDDWTIMQIRAPVPQDPTTISLLFDIDLRSVPGGDMIVTVFDHRPQYLRAPTPDPAIPVPIGAWFQLVAYFRNVADDTGRLTLWLDGQLLYDLHRPSGFNQTVYFTPCSVSEDLSPVASVIYMDDAGVSLAQVGAAVPTDSSVTADAQSR